MGSILRGEFFFLIWHNSLLSRAPIIALTWVDTIRRESTREECAESFSR